MIIYQDPPPYIQFMEEAESLSRLSFAVGMCPTFGFVADEGALQAEFDDFERRAIIAKVTGPVLNRTFQNALDQLTAEAAVIADFGGDELPAEQRAMREERFAEFVGSRCADAVIDYPEVLSLPTRRE